MKFLKEILNALKTLAGFFRFHNRTERLIFFALLVIFAVIQVYFFDNLIIHTRILGYDSYLYSWVPDPQYGVATIRHPLISFLLLPLTLIIKLARILAGHKNSLFILYLFFDVAVCFSVVFIYRICYEIARIGMKRSLLLTLLFFSFAHIIIQPFIFESYPISLLLLCLTFYIAGRELTKGEGSSPFLYGVLLILTAGVTITNAAKTGLAYLFTGRTLNAKFRWAIITGMCFAVLSGAVLVAEKKLAGKKDPSVTEQQGGIEVPITPVKKDTLTVDGGNKIGFLNFFRFDVNVTASARENFFGEAALFHTPEFKKDVSTGRELYLAYDSTLSYVALGLLYLLVLIAIAVSFREMFVKLLLASFGVDVFLHLVCRFGIDEPYIYAAHWMFIIPVLLAWLYRSGKGKYFNYFIDGFLILLSGYFLYMNWTLFFQFAGTI